MSDTVTAQEYQAQHGGHDTEYDLQKEVCRKLDVINVPYFAIPNGQYRPGQRQEAGMQKGVPDLCVPVSSRVYNTDTEEWQPVGALYIELKRDGEYTRPAQQNWLDGLVKSGNVCAVCRSTFSLVYLVDDYLEEKLQHDDDRLWPHGR